jgi:hypothetical protein
MNVPTSPHFQDLTSAVRERLSFRPHIRNIRQNSKDPNSPRIWVAETWRQKKVGAPYTHMRQDRLTHLFNGSLAYSDGPGPNGERQRTKEEVLEAVKKHNQKALERSDLGLLQDSRPAWLKNALKPVEDLWDAYLRLKNRDNAWTRDNSRHYRSHWRQVQLCFPRYSTQGLLFQQGADRLLRSFYTFITQQAKRLDGSEKRLGPDAQKSAFTWFKGFITTLQAEGFWPNGVTEGGFDHSVPPKTPYARWERKEHDPRAGKGLTVPTTEEVHGIAELARRTPITAQLQREVVPQSRVPCLEEESKRLDHADLIVAMAFLGLRPTSEGEPSLRWERITFASPSEATVKLDPEKMKRTKGGARCRGWLELPMHPEAAQALWRMKERQGNPSKGSVISCGFSVWGKRVKYWSQLFWTQRGKPEAYMTPHFGLRPHAINFATFGLKWHPQDLDNYFHNSEQVRRVHYQAETITTSRDLFVELKEKEEESKIIEFMDAVIDSQDLSRVSGRAPKEAI